MTEILVHQTELISVWCDPERSLIRHCIHAYCHSDPIREALNAGTDALIAHECTIWLSDDRLNRPLTPEDADWGKTQWFPRTRAAGWTHWALVKPRQVVAQLNIKQFVDYYHPLGVQAAVFTDLDEAETWVESLQELPAKRPAMGR